MSKIRVDKTNGTQLARFKAYPKYKDSGVEWLGEIPAHWDVQRADTFLHYDKVQMDPSKCTAELVFHYSIPAIQETGSGVIEPPTEIDSAKLEIRADCLLVSKLNPRKGVVVIAHPHQIPTICSTEFVPFEANGCDLRWAFYLFLAESTRQRISAAVRSATRSHQRAEISDITKIWHGVPTVPEQRSIAAFLDCETARIDALVAKREELIKLLQEKRIALIIRAVTKGLDPSVSMKDSGVEWLGEIPAHWEVKRLRQTITSSQNGVWGDEPDGVDDIPCVRVADFDRIHFTVDIADPTLRAIEYSTAQSRCLRRGDLLLEKSGGGEHQPVGAVVTYNHDTPAVCSNFVARLTIEAESESRFMTYLHAALYAMRINTRHIKQSTGIQNLDAESYLGEKAGFPNFAEQLTIACYLDTTTARIDDISCKISESIRRLTEYRVALISAAVTGKIDVRGPAA